jgi:4-hydroxy-3-polyprenylbenzoate decarboxylase
VDWEENIGRITEMLQHTDEAPAVLFDHIPGYPGGYRILVNAQSERSRLAITLGLPLEIGTWELMDEWERRMDESEPVPPTQVADGPVMENVLEGEEVDLFRFPTPLWHPQDGGRYLGTGDCVITRDPEGSWINVGTYRVMVHDRNHTGLYISPGKHGRLHRDKHFARGEPLPAVVLVGMDPLLFTASTLEMAPGLSELEWVGGMRGRPVDCLTGRHTGLPIPARAEIALEGFLHPDRVQLEGPFGEWTGYYASGSREEPVFEVRAVYHRDDPIILGVRRTRRTASASTCAAPTCAGSSGLPASRTSRPPGATGSGAAGCSTWSPSSSATPATPGRPATWPQARGPAHTWAASRWSWTTTSTSPTWTR